MIMERGKRARAWLLCTGVLLLSVFVAVVFVGHLPPSQARTPLVAGVDKMTSLEEEAAGPTAVRSGELLTFTASYTAFLPAVFHDFTYAYLTVAKSAFPTTVSTEPGQVVTYTVTIKNEGDSTATLKTVHDTLPPGFTFDKMTTGSDVGDLPDKTTGTITWSGSWDMPPGAQKRLIYRVFPSQTPGTYTNAVNVTAQDANLPQQPASAAVTVQAPFLLQENFNAGIARWTPFLNHHRLELGQWYWGQGDGTIGSGALTHDCCSGPTGKVASDAVMMYLQPGAQDWTNYRVEANMLLRGGVDNQGNPEPKTGDPIGFWIRGHYQDSPYESQWISGYYVIIVGRSTSATHFVRIAKMQQPGDCDACLKPERMYNFDNPLWKARSVDLPGPFEHYRWYNLAVEVRGANIKVYLDGQLVLDWTDPTLPYLSGTIGFKVHETQTASFDDVVVTPLP
jgi:uncharacterized repeat protein (TIGR01451 family)